MCIQDYMSQPPVVLPTDIDECNGTNPCAPNGNCVNTDVSFTCNCSSGYELDTGGQNCSGKCIHLPVVRNIPVVNTTFYIHYAYIDSIAMVRGV